jgi:hypothetical protein
MSPSPDPAKYQRNYRATHPEFVKQHKASQKRRYEANHRWIFNYLCEHPCVVCGESDPVVLQFDHIGTGRRRDVTGMGALSLKSIQAEIAKCEVVCANHHAIRTAERGNTLRWRLAKGVS